MTRGARIAACVGVVILCAATAAAAEPACIDWEVAGAAIDELVADAIQVLESAGHDPSAYRVELRMESMEQPGVRGIDGRLYRSVVFLPRDGTDAYAVRVHPKYPCELSWVWRPQRLTGWQRRAIQRAQDVMRETWPAGKWNGSLTEVEVLETARTLSVRLWSTDASDEELVVTLEKGTFRFLF